MSINNSDISNPKTEFSNNFSIDRSNFIINSCKNNNNYHKKMKVNENPFKSMEPLMFEKKFNNQFDENKKLVNSLSMVDIKPSFTQRKIIILILIILSLIQILKRFLLFLMKMI